MSISPYRRIGLARMSNVTNYKIQITNKKKGSHGLHQGSFKAQTMTALIKSFYGCFKGPEASRGGFLEKSPPG